MSAHASTNPELPEVSVSTTDTVVVELTPTDAHTLARILAHYDVIVSWRGESGETVPPADGFDRDVWQHTLVRLLAEAENARLQITAPTVIVPFRTRGAHR